MPMPPRFHLLLFFSLFSLSLQSCDPLPELPGAPFSRADAEALTVRIGAPNLGEDGGSGVLVAKQGNTYTVLTNCHVLETGEAGTYTIWLAGGDRYQVTLGNPASYCHGEVDLARFTIETNKNYPVPVLRERSLTELTSETTILVAGYPNRDPNGNPRVLNFNDGRFTQEKPNNPDGYHLTHNVETVGGMSGGPIFDTEGRLLAINGLTETIGTAQVKTYAAIPIRFYTNWEQRTIASNPTVTPDPPPSPKPIPEVQSPPPPTPPMFLGVPVESFDYESARIDSNGKETFYDATGQRYIETELTLPAGAEPLAMVAIEGGTFTMGSPETEVNRDSDEGPQHDVTVPSFLMGQYEVTQAQWKAVAQLPKIDRDLNPDPSYFKGDNNPVENVSWDDAQEFIRRLNQQTGRTYRLPTEAEWEYAARAGTQTPFSYGETITPAVVNYDGNNPYGNAPEGEYRQTTIAVDSLYPNPWGLYHIHGNVWEWVADEWYDSYGDKLKIEKLLNDGSIAWTQDSSGISPSIDGARVLRGGSWYFVARDSRSANRYRLIRVNANDVRGFRVILPAWLP